MLVCVIVVTFVVFIVADYLGWTSKCCPQCTPEEEESEIIQEEKEEWEDDLELFIWVGN